jgi:hypothetical protein
MIIGAALVAEEKHHIEFSGTGGTLAIFVPNSIRVGDRCGYAAIAGWRLLRRNKQNHFA